MGQVFCLFAPSIIIVTLLSGANVTSLPKLQTFSQKELDSYLR